MSAALGHSFRHKNQGKKVGFDDAAIYCCSCDIFLQLIFLSASPLFEQKGEESPNKKETFLIPWQHLSFLPPLSCSKELSFCYY